MQHDRAVLLAILADVAGVQPLGQHIVELQRPALPGAADGVAQVELQLRAIEGALVRDPLDLDAGRALAARSSVSSAIVH